MNDFARRAILLLAAFFLAGCSKKEMVSYEKTRPAAKPRLLTMIESTPSLELSAIKESPSAQSLVSEPLVVEGDVFFRSRDDIGPILVEITYQASVGEVSAQSGIGELTEVDGLKWRYRVELNAPLEPRSYDVRVKCLQLYVAKCKLSVK